METCIAIKAISIKRSFNDVTFGDFLITALGKVFWQIPRDWKGISSSCIK
jgi:hypothetical protein